MVTKTVIASSADRATPADTRAELLRLSGRGYTKVRHILRQLPDDVEDRVSVLGPIVTDRKRRSLQLYLLLLTVWSWLEGQDHPLQAAVWARALSTATGRQWTPTNVSATWSDLEERGLITRKRLSRGVVIVPRREDGQDEYTSPGTAKKNRRETYFVLPPEFWVEDWFEKLTLPGLAMLLIIAGETSERDKQEVWLTNEWAALWYGLSARSVEAGIEDLRENGLLVERVEWVKAPLSPIGSTKRHWYSLTDAFSTEERLAMQDTARRDFERRTGTAKKAPAKKAAKKAVKKGAAKQQPKNTTTNKRTKKLASGGPERA